ncbi:hypothetical protein ABZ883_30985 [Streptomyces sp. NPDC046977]|uniref:hypothetical protein n=1 Tax=Streptomyces sp. NPDC046977 TaxID=3154703 RepID=UPI0033C1AE8B
MVELCVLLGLLVSFAALLIVKLLRRGTSRTQNADGLRIEQAHRDQAHEDRMSYSSVATHNYPFTTGGPYGG